MPLIHSGPAWVPANTTPAGTGSATAETDLQTVSIPEGMLTTGDIVRVTSSGTTAGTAGTHAVALYFGATKMVQFTGFATADQWSLWGVVVVTGAATQKSSALAARGGLGATVNHDYVTLSEAVSGAIAVKTTGTTSSAGDEVTSELLIVEVIPG